MLYDILTVLIPSFNSYPNGLHFITSSSSNLNTAAYGGWQENIVFGKE